MKKSILILCGMWVTIHFLMVTGLSEVRSETLSNKTTGTVIEPLPASLHNFYPPAVDQPVYLFKMVGLAEPYAGIIADLFEGDHGNLDADFEMFRSRYTELSNMIPEWSAYYPMEPVENLKKAISTRDRDQVMAAIEGIDTVCQNCHLPYMARVHFTYRWPRFQEITVTDPVTKSEIRYQQLMQFLEVNLTGIGLDVHQNQVENAKGHMRDFRARFEVLKDVCMECHDTERTYYVDEGSTRRIDILDRKLSESPLNTPVIEKMLQEIGGETCMKCHLVHGPAGMAQLEMEK